MPITKLMLPPLHYLTTKLHCTWKELQWMQPIRQPLYKSAIFLPPSEMVLSLHDDSDDNKEETAQEDTPKGQMTYALHKSCQHIFKSAEAAIGPASNESFDKSVTAKKNTLNLLPKSSRRSRRKGPQNWTMRDLLPSIYPLVMHSQWIRSHQLLLMQQWWWHGCSCPGKIYSMQGTLSRRNARITVNCKNKREAVAAAATHPVMGATATIAAPVKKWVAGDESNVIHPEDLPRASFQLAKTCMPLSTVARMCSPICFLIKKMTKKGIQGNCFQDYVPDLTMDKPKTL